MAAELKNQAEEHQRITWAPHVDGANERLTRYENKITPWSPLVPVSTLVKLSTARHGSILPDIAPAMAPLLIMLFFGLRESVKLRDILTAKKNRKWSILEALKDVVASISSRFRRGPKPGVNLEKLLQQMEQHEVSRAADWSAPSSLGSNQRLV